MYEKPKWKRMQFAEAVLRGYGRAGDKEVVRDHTDKRTGQDAGTDSETDNELCP